MSEQTDQQTPDMMQAWREWLTQTERQFNGFFAEAMNQEQFARGVGSYMEMTASFQRMMGETMQRYLTFMNMPSRNDVTDLGETLLSIEGRLAQIEEMLQIAATAVDLDEEQEAPRPEPTRTRTPASYAAPAPAATPAPTPPSAAKPVPEGLRR